MTSNLYANDATLTMLCISLSTIYFLSLSIFVDKFLLQKLRVRFTADQDYLYNTEICYGEKVSILIMTKLFEYTFHRLLLLDVIIFAKHVVF